MSNSPAIHSARGVSRNRGRVLAAVEPAAPFLAGKSVDSLAVLGHPACMVSVAAPAHDLHGETVLEKLRANTARFVEMNAALGGLFTRAQAALLLGVAKQRVAQLLEDGRLIEHEFTIEHQGGEKEVVGRFVSGAQIERYLAVERKQTGRPSKLRMLAAALDPK